MAIIQNPLIGRAKQKLAGTVFQTWKGKNVLRSKPISVENPNTIPQQTQRNKMKLAVSIYRLISSAIAIGFKQQAVGKSEYNAFVSEALKTAITSSVPPTASFTPNNLIVAKGTMGTTAVSSATADTGNDYVEINWAGGTVPVAGSANDIPKAVVYNETKEEWGTVVDAAVRTDGTTSVYLPSAMAENDEISVYLFFVSPDGSVVSDSVYQAVTAES